MKRAVKTVMLSVLVSALTLYLSSCAELGAQRVENTPRAAATSVPTKVPLLSSTVVIASGVVQPAEWVELGFQLGGLVAEVAVTPGDKVQAGQLLARLEAAELEQAVVQAEATLAMAQARLAQAQAGAQPEELVAAEAAVATAEAQLAQAEAGVKIAQAALKQAQAQVDQVQAAFEGAQAQVAQTEAQVEAARARVDAAQVQLDQARAQRDLLLAGAQAEELAVLEAQVKRAEAALAQARMALGETRLMAPFAGRVVAVEAQLGETVGLGQIVVVLADLDTLYVHTVDLDQFNVAKVKPGQEVRVLPDALLGRELSGRVTFVSLRGIGSGGDTVYTVVIELVDRDPDLRWGMTVIAEITTTP